jgi:hypothetical protein
VFLGHRCHRLVAEDKKKAKEPTSAAENKKSARETTSPGDDKKKAKESPAPAEDKKKAKEPLSDRFERARKALEELPADLELEADLGKVSEAEGLRSSYQVQLELLGRRCRRTIAVPTRPRSVSPTTPRG